MVSGSLGVEHHSQGGSHGSGGQVALELRDHGSVVSVGSADLAPDGSEGFSLLGGLGLVDVGDPLAQVEPHVVLAVHVLDLDQGLVDVLPESGPAEPDEDALHVESGVAAVLLLFAHWINRILIYKDIN